MMQSLSEKDRAHVADAGQQFLTFTLGGEVYAVRITAVREIIEYAPLTEIPLMPEFLRGVINLRGSVVPVIDLSVRFCRGRTTIARRTCIVIVEMPSENSLQTVGVLVDAVNEVLSLEPDEVEPSPGFGTTIRAEFVAGVINWHERLVLVLDISQVLDIDELAHQIGLSDAAQGSDTAHVIHGESTDPVSF